MRHHLRPVLAAALALVFPGLGHLSLRRWRRALLWHLTLVGGGVALLALYDVEPVDPLADPAAVSASLPADVVVPIAFVAGLSAIDAFLVGRTVVADRNRDAVAAVHRRAATADGEAGGPADPGSAAADGEALTVTCPHCGEETDAELDFCTWCTEPLPWSETD